MNKNNGENFSGNFGNNGMQTLFPSAATGGFAYSTAVVIYIVISVVAAFVLIALPKYGYAYWFLNFLPSPIAICIALAVTIKVRKVPVKLAFPVKCKVRYYVVALLLAFGLFFSLSRVNDLILQLFHLSESETYVELSEFLNDLSGGWVVLAIVVIALLPAIFEEGLFRGVILNSTEGGAGTLKTIFIVGFAFSLFHGSPEQTVYQFIAGCIFALVAIRSGSIIPGILMHFINNALVIILTALKVTGEDGTLFNPTAQTVLMAVGFVALFVGLVYLILDRKIIEKTPLGQKVGAFFEHKPAMPAKKGEVARFFIYGSVGIAVLAVMWIVNLVALITG